MVAPALVMRELTCRGAPALQTPCLTILPLPPYPSRPCLQRRHPAAVRPAPPGRRAAGGGCRNAGHGGAGPKGCVRAGRASLGFQGECNTTHTRRGCTPHHMSPQMHRLLLPACKLRSGACCAMGVDARCVCKQPPLASLCDHPRCTAPLPCPSSDHSRPGTQGPAAACERVS